MGVEYSIAPWKIELAEQELQHDITDCTGLILNQAITKILIALALLVNPVVVLAGNFHDIEIWASQSSEKTPCETTRNQEMSAGLAQSHSTDCEKPCCEDTNCFVQVTCVFHLTTAVLTQIGPKATPSIAHRNWDASITDVPDRSLPPENPPPIHR
jgi:hypothetical protein